MDFISSNFNLRLTMKKVKKGAQAYDHHSIFKAMLWREAVH